MAKDSAVMERMHTSFRMILDFWGFELVAPSAEDAAAAAGGACDGPEPEPGSEDGEAAAAEGGDAPARPVVRRQTVPGGGERLTRINASRDHNHLRITRVLKCLHALGEVRATSRLANRMRASVCAECPCAGGGS